MASNNQGRGVEDGDDDFEDFGGFEAADPVPDMPAAQAQAAASPWALFNAGNAPGRPDLLCAQNRFPNYLDPSGIAGPGAGAGSDMDLNNHASGNPPDLPPQADLLGGQLLGNQARIAENVLDGTLNPTGEGGGGVGGPPGYLSNLNAINGRLPDIGLGTNENRLFGGQPVNGPELLDPAPAIGGGRENAVHNNHPALPPPFELPLNNPVPAAAVVAAHPVGDNDPHVVVREGAVAEIHAGVDRPAAAAAVDVAVAAAGGSAAAAAVVPGAHSNGVPPAAVADSSRDNALQQRLAALSEENRRLEEELSRCREDLDAQRSRLREVEARQQAELEDVRRAGHDALAVVVEQYKEQSKTVVLEQQEAARRHIAEVVREQMKAFQDMLMLQQEQQEQQKKEDKEELERQIAQALEKSRQEQQEQFQTFLTEEQERQRKAADKALEEERVANQGKMQESIDAEVDRGRARLEESRAEASEKLEEERRNHEAALAAVREEEKRLAQEQLSQLGREERERSRELTREAVEASRLESRNYLQEQRQADARVRQRHLASLDLFLESSRQQIALLMESERHVAPIPPSLSRQEAAASSAAANEGTSKESPPSNDGAHSHRGSEGS